MYDFFVTIGHPLEKGIHQTELLTWIPVFAVITTEVSGKRITHSGPGSIRAGEFPGNNKYRYRTIMQYLV